MNLGRTKYLFVNSERRTLDLQADLHVPLTATAYLLYLLFPPFLHKLKPSLHHGSAPLKLYAIYLYLYFCNHPELVTKRHTCTQGSVALRATYLACLQRKTCCSTPTGRADPWENTGNCKGVVLHLTLNKHRASPLVILFFWGFQMHSSRSETHLHHTSVHPWNFFPAENTPPGRSPSITGHTRHLFTCALESTNLTCMFSSELRT